MDMSTLAQKMLEWEKITRQAYDLGEEIRAAVLEIGKTQKVGNVTASFANGRKTYDYYAAGKDAPQSFIDEATETVTRTDWRMVCVEAGIEAPYIQGAPSVTLKLSSE